MGVIVLHIVVVGLVEDAIGVVVAVRVLISDPSGLTHRGVRVEAKAAVQSWGSCRHRSWLPLLVLALASDEEDALVETTDNRNLRLGLLLLCRLLGRSGAGRPIGGGDGRGSRR